MKIKKTKYKILKHKKQFHENGKLITCNGKIIKIFKNKSYALKKYNEYVNNNINNNIYYSIEKDSEVSLCIDNELEIFSSTTTIIELSI